MDRALGVIDRLISRKLWIAVAGDLIVALWPDIDPETRVAIIGGVTAVYVVAQAVVDALQGTLPAAVARKRGS